MAAEGRRPFRDLDAAAAGELEGVWVAGVLGDAPSTPPTPLGFQLVVDDALLLGTSLQRRGVSLPRLSRRFIRVDGHAYHAFAPLARAARSLAPLDAGGLALALAGEAREDARQVYPQGAPASTLTLGRVLARARAELGELRRRVIEHESDASHHYRWLIEMDLGILPDDALGTTLEECAAIQRSTRELETEATLALLGAYAGVSALGERAGAVSAEQLLAALLVPDTLELASVTPALALSCVAQVQLRRQVLGDVTGPAALLSEFVKGFGERGPREREPAEPRWSETPQRLQRLVEVLMRADPELAEARLAGSRRDRREVIERVLLACGPLEALAFRTLLGSVHELLTLRSRLHRVRARTLAMLRMAVLDVDRRLLRLMGATPGSAFFLKLAELLDSTVRPSRELAGRARERRERWERVAERRAPAALLGRALVQRASDALLTGVGVGGPVVRGRARLAADVDAALLVEPGEVLVMRSLDPGWAPLLLAASAVVTDAGGVTDEGVMAACALGVPIVVGAREATQRLFNGDALQVDTRAGTVQRL